MDAAVYASGRFLRQRHLPDRAIDLVDEAGARARHRRESEPADIVEIRKRIRALTREIENAIGNHDFARARQCEEAQHKEREDLGRLTAEREQRAQGAQATSVTPQDIVAVVAERAGVPAVSVEQVLRQKGSGDLQRITEELAAIIAVGGEWVPVLAAHLARCSPEEAERLARAIPRLAGWRAE